MREKETKAPEENDPIKRMLERLRRSVTDLPPEATAPEKPSESARSSDALEAVQALKQKIASEEESAVDAEISDAEALATNNLSFVDNTRQTDGEAPEDREDALPDEEIDEAVIAEFFEVVEEPAEVEVEEKTEAEAEESASSDASDEPEIDDDKELFLIADEEDASALEDMTALDGEEEGDPFLAFAEEMLREDATRTPSEKPKKEPKREPPATPVDAFATAFPLSVEDEEAEGAPGVSYLTAKPDASVRGDALQKNLQKSIEGIASGTKEADLGYTAVAMPTPFDAPKEKNAPVAQPTVEPEETIVMHTEISDREAELLFAPRRRRTEEDARLYTHRSAVREDRDLLVDNVDATEENGYAVEVEVAGLSKQAPAPTPALQETAPPEESDPNPAPAPAPRREEEVPVIDMEQDGNDEALCDDFLELLAEGRVHASGGKQGEETSAAKKPNLFERRKSIRKAEKVLGDSVTGEQISMDLFSEAASETTAADEEEYAESTAASDTAATPSFVEIPEYPEELDNGYHVSPPLEETVTSDPAPVAAVRTEARMAEPEPVEEFEESAPASVDREAEKAARAALRAQKKQDRKQRLAAARKEFYQEELSAVAGIYEEHAASYNEFTSQGQIGAIGRRFLSRLSSTAVRVFGLALLTVLFFLSENMPLFRLSIEAFFPNQMVLIALHFVAVALTVLCSVPVFSTAWRGIFCRRITSDLYLSILLILTLLYDICLLLIPTGALHFFGFLTALAALVSAIADHRKIHADFSAFRLLSSAGDKLACKITKGGTTAAERGAVSDLPEGQETRVMSVKKIGFANGFFHRITRSCEDSRINLILLLACATVSLAAALIGGLLASSFLVAIFSMLVAFSLSLPVLLLVLHKVPLACLSHRAGAQRSAVVGEVSAIEYSDIGAIAFEDVEAFSSRNVVVQRVKTYAGSTIVDVLYRVASLFSVVGGPLDGVFHSCTADIGMSENVTLLSAEEGGILASVDERELSVGSGDYMLAHRIHVYFDPDDEKILAGGKVNILYAAEEGKLIAKFYIRYKMNEDFEKHVEQLHKYGIRTIIRTYDPLLSDALIEKISYTAGFGVRVAKKTVEQQSDFAQAELNSGIVSRSSTKNILKTLYACRRTVRFSRGAKIASLALSGLGMVGAILLPALGLISAVPTALLALYQLLSVGVFALFAKLYI